MENSFGSDFSNVNIHTNDGSATEMGALAYTQGDNVHFAPGQYNPGSQKGQELLGHELTHVVQQRQGRVQPTTQRKGTTVNDSPALENEADVMGAKAAQGKDASEVAGKGSGVQKQDNDKTIDVNLVTLPKSDLSYKELIRDNINTSLAILFNHIMALQNFETIVNSASKKETESKGIGEIALKTTSKFVFDLIIDGTLGNFPGAKQVFDLSKNILNDIDAEQKRASSASLSNRIGQFIVTHRTAITEMRSNLETNKVNIVSAADREYNGSDDSYKSVLRNLAETRNNFLTQAQQGTHSINGLYGKLVASWINSSTDSHGIVNRPGLIVAVLDENWNVTQAHIHAPRGQRIAEQLLQSNSGEVDLRGLGARIKLNYCNKIFFDYEGTGAAGKMSYNSWATQEDMNIFMRHFNEKGIPNTKVLTGDD